MADLTLKNASMIQKQYPELYQALSSIVDSHNRLAEQTNASPVGQTPSPESHAALNVTGGQGVFHAEITDNSPAYRGKEHFLEASEDGANWHVMHLGASTSWHGYLGAKVLNFRSYAAYATSGPGAPLYQMNVSGVGGKEPKVTGTGTAAGYGTQPYTGDVKPKR